MYVRTGKKLVAKLLTTDLLIIVLKVSFSVLNFKDRTG